MCCMSATFIQFTVLEKLLSIIPISICAADYDRRGSVETESHWDREEPPVEQQLARYNVHFLSTVHVHQLHIGR